MVQYLRNSETGTDRKFWNPRFKMIQLCGLSRVRSQKMLETKNSSMTIKISRGRKSEIFKGGGEGVHKKSPPLALQHFQGRGRDKYLTPIHIYIHATYSLWNEILNTSSVQKSKQIKKTKTTMKQTQHKTPPTTNVLTLFLKKKRLRKNTNWFFVYMTKKISKE